MTRRPPSTTRTYTLFPDTTLVLAAAPRHSISMTQRLFGGGEVHADLSPSAFLNVATALDAWTDDPDPTDAPYQRSLGERRADALDDLCRASLDPDDNRWSTGSSDEDPSEWEDRKSTRMTPSN